MPIFPQKQRLTDKPAFLDAFDQSHWFANGLVAYFPFRELAGSRAINLARGPDAFLANTNWRYDKLSNTTAGAGGGRFTLPANDSLNTVCTAAGPRSWGYRINVTGNTSNKLVTDVNGFTGQCLWSETQTSGGGYRIDGGVSTSNRVNSPILDLNRYYSVVFTFDGSTTRQYIDGVLVDSSTQTSASVFNGVLYALGWGNFAPDCLVDYLFVSARAFSEYEVSQLHKSPWSMFERRIWVPVGGSVGPVVMSLGQATSTSTANSISIQSAVSATLNQAQESDTANAVSAASGVSTTLQQAVENDSANSVSASTDVATLLNQATETDTGNPINAAAGVSATLSQASETSTANQISLSSGLTTLLSQAIESNTAQQINAVTDVAAVLNQASETDSANEVTAGVSVSSQLGQASEVATAQSVTLSAITSTVLGQAQELDEALSVDALTTVQALLGIAVENSSAFSITASTQAIPGACPSTDEITATIMSSEILPGISFQSIIRDLYVERGLHKGNSTKFTRTNITDTDGLIDIEIKGDGENTTILSRK